MLSFLGRGRWRDTAGRRGSRPFPGQSGHQQVGSSAWGVSPRHPPRLWTLWPCSTSLAITFSQSSRHANQKPLPNFCALKASCQLWATEGGSYLQNLSSQSCPHCLLTICFPPAPQSSLLTRQLETSSNWGQISEHFINQWNGLHFF